jgi:hypothetical protein
MAVPGIEHRVAALEADVARLKEQLAKAVPAQGDWLDEIYGAFENDPIYEEAMRLGREYRESLRPKPHSRRSERAQPAKAKKR